MDITLTPEMEQFVSQKVKAGEYDSASAVIHDALDMLKVHEQLSAVDDEDLRGEIAAGIEDVRQGDIGPLDMKTIRDEVRRLRAEDRRSG